MNPLVPAAVKLQQSLSKSGWKSCVIGGLAVLRWGEPRMTQDVDFSVLVEFGKERAFATQVLSVYPGLFEDSEQIAIESRVLPINVDGVPIDLSLACFPFEEEIIDRGSAFEFDAGMRLLTISAEDLIVMKAIAGRPIDWQDVEGVIIKQAEQLDVPAVFERLEALKELAELDAQQRVKSLLAEFEN